MFGSHLSIAGGMSRAAVEAGRLGLATVQVFTKNQQQWKVAPLAPSAVSEWLAELDRLRFAVSVSHASYLINLASPDETSWLRGIDLLAEELRRCDTLRIPYLVIHPGAHMESGEAAGLARVATAVERARLAVAAPAVTICLESTAGQGTCLGHRLEHLSAIIDHVDRNAGVGVCLDTAHLFAAGYDFRGRRYAKFIREVDATIGLHRVKVWHLNDSKKPLGSRVDRHEHIGQGQIGDTGFRPIVRDRLWKNVPKILETPKGKSAEGVDWDTVNVNRLIAMSRK